MGADAVARAARHEGKTRVQAVTFRADRTTESRRRVRGDRLALAVAFHDPDESSKMISALTPLGFPSIRVDECRTLAVLSRRFGETVEGESTS